jgi:hypothetical protein
VVLAKALLTKPAANAVRRRCRLGCHGL